jgi:hypothetical protein
VLRGVVGPDGTLEVPGKVQLTPGPVEVTVRAVAAASKGEDVLAVLARIRAEQEASGEVPRSVEEIDAAIQQMRDEWEEHDLAIERLQDDCAHSRQAASGTEPSA